MMDYELREIVFFPLSKNNSLQLLHVNAQHALAKALVGGSWLNQTPNVVFANKIACRKDRPGDGGFKRNPHKALDPVLC